VLTCITWFSVLVWYVGLYIEYKIICLWSLYWFLNLFYWISVTIVYVL